MGDFLQFDSTKTNMKSDEDYAASSYRTGGCVEGVAPSDVHNKLFYQTSTMVKALADAMIGKGYTVSDESLAQLVVVLSDLVTNADMIAYAAKLAGDATQAFSAADGASGKQVVNISQFASSIAANGYIKFPGGLILQWGTCTPSSGWVSFPIAFPTAAFGWAGTAMGYAGMNLYLPVCSAGVEQTRFYPMMHINGDSNPVGELTTWPMFWIAVGH